MVGVREDHRPSVPESGVLQYFPFLKAATSVTLCVVCGLHFPKWWHLTVTADILGVRGAKGGNLCRPNFY